MIEDAGSWRCAQMPAGGSQAGPDRGFATETPACPFPAHFRGGSIPLGLDSMSRSRRPRVPRQGMSLAPLLGKSRDSRVSFGAADHQGRGAEQEVAETEVV